MVLLHVAKLGLLLSIITIKINNLIINLESTHLKLVQILADCYSTNTGNALPITHYFFISDMDIYLLDEKIRIIYSESDEKY